MHVLFSEGQGGGDSRHREIDYNSQKMQLRLYILLNLTLAEVRFALSLSTFSNLCVSFNDIARNYDILHCSTYDVLWVIVY